MTVMSDDTMDTQQAIASISTSGSVVDNTGEQTELAVVAQRKEAELHLNAELSPSLTSRFGLGRRSTPQNLTAQSDSLALAVSNRGRKRNKKIDLLSADFIGPAEAIKSLFSLPYDKSGRTFALHKCGNLLMVDTMWGDAFEDSDDESTNESRVSQVMTSEGLLCNLVDTLQNRSTVSELQPSQSDDLHLTMPLSCPLTPPPAFYVPSAPKAASALLKWQFHEMQIAVGSSMPVYQTELHPALSVQSYDTTKEVELHTCLDFYLDNIMANVPELALCMHAKGFIRGWKIIPTEDIPNLSRYTDDMRGPQNPPLFDPSVVDFNATMLLRFLKEHCKAEEGTYILRKGPNDSGEALHLYDLRALSESRSKRWKWLLAMLCYRFAVRIAQHMEQVDVKSRGPLLHRQRRLLHICLELLKQLTELGSDSHDTIQAAVLEHLANTHLVYHPRDEDSDENDDFDSRNELRLEELEAAEEYLAQGINIIERIVTRHRARSSGSSQSDINADSIRVGDVEVPCGREDRAHVVGESKGSTDSSPELAEVTQTPKEDDGDDLIEELVCMQLSGMVFKRLSVTMRVIRYYLSTSQPLLALTRLLEALQHCRLWASVIIRTSQDGGTTSLRKSMTALVPSTWAILGELCRELLRQADVIDLISTVEDVAVACCDAAVVHSITYTSICCDPALIRGSVFPRTVVKPHPLHRCGARMCRSAMQGSPYATSCGDVAVSPEIRLMFLRAFSESLVLSILSYPTHEDGTASFDTELHLLQQHSQHQRETVGDDKPGMARSNATLLATHTRRLGDVCNELAKHYLAQATDATKQKLPERQMMAEAAGDWLQEALACFNTVKDSVNAALVRCNLSSLCRLYGTNVIPRPEGMTLHTSVRNSGKYCGSHARHDTEELEGEMYLKLALDICKDAHDALETRELHPHAWDTVSQEAAMTYLTIGVAQRQACQGSGVPLQVKEERRVVEPLQTALRIYEDLHNHRQAAAAHFHLGSFYSKLWSNLNVESRATSALRLALEHYSQAYQYYSTQDIGPTLVLISTDMYDLYMATYECLKSTTAVLPAGTSPEAYRSHAIAMQQAFCCMLNSHNAFTPAVYQRYRKEMYRFACGVVKRLSKAILELLKFPAPELLFGYAANSPDLSKTIVSIRGAYRRLLTDLQQSEPANVSQIDDQAAENYVSALGTFLSSVRQESWAEAISKSNRR